ncbi:hypothetical protein MycrhN_3808 [Mycolicibacterium rhodesiae NBB3]|uniref:Uncharacterized protein n=1 Tax=Mycolicibacterium rhodesiae (strain NBB3) TaxID=710685 RepID=G8RWL6_MYCRN|nr:hypothetical protein [Mycolicibacterium rhodesiae]AEV74324.1 hypothetical protein MycrhN_3808 [Mycolicibacterium rhodesiae NBB3]
MAADDRQPAFEQWLRGLNALTASADAARQWRERRYEFAYRLGEKLVGQTATHPAVVGSAVYGIWLRWGLLYVGQTNEASRRLRDLPVGESHHLANTFPPEIWDRVVVIDWPSLTEAEAALAQLDQATIGLAIEHRLQVRVQPLANASRRTKGGGWRDIDRNKSRSRGARAAEAIGELAHEVDRLWDIAAVREPGSEPLPAAVRSVRPGDLLGHEHAV